MAGADNVDVDIHSTAEALENAKSLFISEFHRWLDGNCGRRRCDDNFKVEKVCEMMHNVFWTPPAAMDGAMLRINPTQVEQIIEQVRARELTWKERSFRIGKPSETEWILHKRIRGKASELKIGLNQDGTVSVHAYDDVWGYTAFGPVGLESMIGYWADGCGQPVH